MVLDEVTTGQSRSVDGIIPVVIHLPPSSLRIRPKLALEQNSQISIVRPPCSVAETLVKVGLF
jgi:hypothetical protein